VNRRLSILLGEHATVFQAEVWAIIACVHENETQDRRAGSQSAASRGCAMLSVLVKHRLFFLLPYTPLLCIRSYLCNKLAISIFICPPLLHLLTCCFPFQYHYSPQYAQLCMFTNVCLKVHLH